MLPNELIEKALKLTGKTVDDMNELKVKTPMRPPIMKWVFCIEKFCYYLLSTEFIEKYSDIHYWNNPNLKPRNRYWSIVAKVGKTIYDYQSWKEQPLIDLLTKI